MNDLHQIAIVFLVPCNSSPIELNRMADKSIDLFLRRANLAAILNGVPIQEILLLLPLTTLLKMGLSFPAPTVVTLRRLFKIILMRVMIVPAEVTMMKNVVRNS